MIQMLRNMGLRYVLFRIWFEIQRRTGLLRLRFPTQSKQQSHYSKADWLQCNVKFMTDPAILNLEKNQNLPELMARVQHVQQNRFQYFSGQWFTVTDWHTNPENGFSYDKMSHWSTISTHSKQAGDIKYIWEKSRFCFLYDLIRYDFHFENDQSEIVSAFINDWIEQNPVNRGPNWLCGQEISFRVINWTFALHYYKHSKTLTSELFSKIMCSIREQMQHVALNINFSRIAVRNNHALTETLALFVTGLCFPLFPESAKWRRNGKKWFESEIAYQVYADGTYLQFSMNYHRIVVQLLTLAIRLAELNDEHWAPVIYNRAAKSLRFLRSCQDDQTGWLPNYGNNDGALFFPITECHYRDFRPQLESLSRCLAIALNYGKGPWNEESGWFSGFVNANNDFQTHLPESLTSLEKGGYHIIRDDNSLTFLKCGAYRDRPFQADNLHLDIWANGVNIMRDAGSFSYNTDDKWLQYFNGTAAHNTAMLGNFDQMQKGPRFTWFHWIKKAESTVYESVETFEINAEFEGFYHLGKGIKHRRRVSKTKNRLHWIIEDWIANAPSHLPMRQIWHPNPLFLDHYHIAATDDAGQEICLSKKLSWHSETYGLKEEGVSLEFASTGRSIRTVIEQKHI
ncbi:alginate lyase family protein [Dyadobacter sp. CY326]|uniref:alginate lyase family protein n=1 Tax=Dyadobacter sp. CY326 TaxID=2907300 RepID=UPI001F1ED7AD|nr:alginate lyase family protein [Dyadobacter sp. CY326]MCE7068412.1 heparinase II/III family protein [Dyadobacter sp. CY326]